MAQVDKTFQIFRAGTHRSTNGESTSFSQADLSEMASGYSQGVLIAPLVLGHTDSGAPAYGNVKRLFMDGVNLFAEAAVDGTLIQMVRDGKYLSVSPEIYRPDSPYNPTPGRFYLKRVAFLGAQPPAVKGMAALNFGESFHVGGAFSAHPLVAAAELQRLTAMNPRKNVTGDLPQTSCNPMAGMNASGNMPDVSSNPLVRAAEAQRRRAEPAPLVADSIHYIPRI